MIFGSTEDVANCGRRRASVVMALQPAAFEAEILTTPTSVSLGIISALLLERGWAFAPLPLQANTQQYLYCLQRLLKLKEGFPLHLGGFRKTHKVKENCLLSLDSAKCKRDLILFLPMDTQKDSESAALNLICLFLSAV